MIKKISLFFVLITFIVACSGGASDNLNNDDFNRKEMLTYWADNMIIPAYTNFSEKTKELKTTTTNFTTTSNQENLSKLRAKWQEVYVLWQKVAPFQIGKAVALNLLPHINTYPTEVKRINDNIINGVYDLTSINLSGQQGLPAIDYLINGLGANDTAILGFYNGANALKYKKYLNDLANRMVSLTNQVLTDWKGGYRETFINNDGNTGTSSVPNMVNSYIIEFYEKSIRKAKIEIPSGARGTSNPIPKNVEAYYKKDISKLLLTTAITTAQNFFNGKSFDGTITGKSLKQYLIFLKQEKLVNSVNTQFENIKKTVTTLNNNFVTQIKTDNTKMVQTFEKLQGLVIYLKTNMVSAMSIPITNGTDGDND